MAGHDPQRTSWAAEESVGATNSVLWVKPLDPWIPSRSQIITAEGRNGRPDLLFVATAKGVYALNPASGAEAWFYPLEPGSGDTPAFANDVLYIPGTDHTVHAVDAYNGQKLWQTAMAGGAFYSSPLVVNNRVFIGNHDGYFYCFSAADGALVWSFKAGGPIALSAAYQSYGDYPNGVLFFAARDNHAYALRAESGQLVWKSPTQFKAESITSYWPVVFQERVIFVAYSHYPVGDDPGLLFRIKPGLYANEAEVAAHIDGAGWLDLENHVAFLSQHPELKTFFVLDRRTGAEAETAPIYYWGNGGVRYPPLVGPNPVGSGNLLWATTPWLQSYFNSGRYAGWQIGTAKVRTVPAPEMVRIESSDEPEAAAIIGASFLYYNRGGDGVDGGGRFLLGGGGEGDLWNGSRFGNYSPRWSERRYGNFQGLGMEGHQNPPVPLKGRVYFHRSNAVIGMGP